MFIYEVVYIQNFTKYVPFITWEYVFFREVEFLSLFFFGHCTSTTLVYGDMNTP